MYVSIYECMYASYMYYVYMYVYTCVYVFIFIAVYVCLNILVCNVCLTGPSFVGTVGSHLIQ